MKNKISKDDLPRIVLIGFKFEEPKEAKELVRFVETTKSPPFAIGCYVSYKIRAKKGNG